MRSTNRRPDPAAALVMFLSLLVGAATAQANINMALLPATISGNVGDVVELNLVVTPDNGVTQAFLAVDAILNWNPSDLLLVGFTNAHAGHSWFFFGFPNDTDHLNDSTTDGDAVYSCLASPGDVVNAPPAGLIVTTFQFRILRHSAGAPVTLRPNQGQFARSRVHGTQPGLEVTGTLSSAVVRSCGDGDVDGNGSVNATDLALFINVMLGSDTNAQHVANADVNCDGLSDGGDVQAMVARFIP